MNSRETYDYSKLRGKIKEKCGTQRKFAESLGRSNNHVSNLLNNYTQFEQGDIDKSVAILDIPKDDIFVYFFTRRVHKNGTVSEAHREL